MTNDEYPDDDAPQIEHDAVRLPPLTELKQKFRNAIDSSEAARELSSLDRGYYDGNRALSEQWKRNLESHNLVPLNINIVQPIVNGTIGVVLQSATDPVAYPNSPQAQGAADVATKVLRYAADRNDIDDIKGDCAENFFIEGMTAVIVEASDKAVFVRRIHPNEFFADPHSREYDYSDARYMGIAKWLHVSQIHALFPDSERYGQITPGSDLMGESRTMRDGPELWVDRKNQRVMVVEMYYVEDQTWKRIVYCHCGVLDFGDSAYLDDEGMTMCPIVPISCYINQDLDDNSLTYSRYGVIRSMISPQDEYNAHRSAMLKAAVSRRVQQVDTGAPPVNTDTVRQEASRPDGVIPPGWQIVPSNDLQEQNALLQLARNEADRMGPTPAVLGRSLSDSASGRSRMVQQQAGLTEMGPILGRFEKWEGQIYRHMWFAIRQYWTAQMYVRVSGMEKAPEFLSVNVPQIEMRNVPVVGPDGQPQINPMTGAPVMREQAVTIGIENELAAMDMDIKIVPTKESVTLESETRDQLIQIMQVIPPDSSNFLIALELFPLSNKIETIERIKALQAQAQQASAQAQQAQAQQAAQAQGMAQQQAEAQQADLIAKARKHDAQATKTEVETQAMVNASSIPALLAQYAQDQRPNY